MSRGSYARCALEHAPGTDASSVGVLVLQSRVGQCHGSLSHGLILAFFLGACVAHGAEGQEWQRTPADTMWADTMRPNTMRPNTMRPDTMRQGPALSENAPSPYGSPTHGAFLPQGRQLAYQFDSSSDLVATRNAYEPSLLPAQRPIEAPIGVPYGDPYDLPSVAAYESTRLPPGSVLYDSAGAQCSRGERFRLGLEQFGCDVCSDYGRYYTWNTMGDLALALAGAAVFANSSLDADFQNWYQRDIRSDGTDNLAVFWKTFGEGQIFIPAFIGLAVAGTMWEDEWPVLGVTGEYSERVTRGYLVGGPAMLVMQFTLGGSRPGETSAGSRWKPFDDTNAVSGHAFMGAVPFITAAQMVENPWARRTLYACSTFTAWSRVNDNDHYLSQACLGWYMAYLACRVVNDTEDAKRCYSFAPVAAPNMLGLAVVVRR